MKALTVDAIWAWAILTGRKRIENRTWSTSYRGPLAIHAGVNSTRDAAARSFLGRIKNMQVPAESRIAILRGNLVGIADLEEIYVVADMPVELRNDPFCEGPVCWVLRNARWLEKPLPCSGKQGLWETPAGLLDSLNPSPSLGAHQPEDA